MPAQRQAADPLPDLAQRLHAVAIRLLRRARREDALLGLPPGQSSALSVLVFGGAKTLSQLAAIEQVQPPTMTRMVDALVRAGLATRVQDPADRRRFEVSASAAGVRLMHKGRDRRVAVLAKLLAGVRRDQRATLAAAVEILERAQREADG